MTIGTASCTCDNCGKDITQGNGRMWRLNMYAEVVQKKDGTTSTDDAGYVLPMSHVCDLLCGIAYLTEQQTKRTALIAADKEDAVAKAATK